MKNFDVIELCNAGILDITSNDLEAEDAYNVYRFKKEMRKIYKELSENEKDLFEQVKIGDPAKFDKEYKAAIEAEDNEKRAEYESKLYRLGELRQAMISQDVNLDNIQKISYKSWHKLQKENSESKALKGYNEELLENVLWYSEI